MRHKNAGRKFDRNTSHRRAMFRNLAANLILHERIETTDAKAKELRRVAERLITKARPPRRGRVHAAATSSRAADKARAPRDASASSRAFLPRFGERASRRAARRKKVDLVEKVFVDLAKRFQGRPGGYTRIIKLGPRRGDNAPMVVIEFVDQAAAAEEAEEKPKKKKAKKAAAKAEEAKAE